MIQAQANSACLGQSTCLVPSAAADVHIRKSARGKEKETPLSWLTFGCFVLESEDNFILVYSCLSVANGPAQIRQEIWYDPLELFLGRTAGHQLILLPLISRVLSRFSDRLVVIHVTSVIGGALTFDVPSPLYACLSQFLSFDVEASVIT